MMKIKSFALFVLMFALVSCQSASKINPDTATSTITTAPLPVSTNTPAPSPTSTPTVDQLMYPYTIDGLRHHDFQSGSVHIRAQLEQTDLYTRFLIDYPSDGLTITAIMQVPVNGQAPFPVIVMNHGFFPRASYASGDGTWRAAEYLNKYGYLTIAPDYRSWGGSDVGPSLYYSGLVIDIINLIHDIPSIPEADPNRVGIWGHSMGGGVTLKALEVVSNLKAAVLYSTVSGDDADILARWGLGCIGDIAAGELRLGCNSSDVVPISLPANLIQAYKDSSTEGDLLHQISPIYHLDLVTVPVEINYGTKDGQTLSGTPPDWSKKLYQAFKDAGKDAQLFAYDGEYHSFNGDAWLAFMDRSRQFFDQYVKSTP